MKKFNFIYLLLAFVGVMSMTSCEHKYEDYAPGNHDENMGVYLPSTAVIEVTAETKSVDIAVARFNTTNAAEVSVRAEYVAVSADDTAGELFTIPQSVSFAAGNAEANFTVTFDGSKLEAGREYGIRVQLDAAEASNYAVSEHVFTIIIPEPWETMGTGTYVDDFFRVFMAAIDDSTTYPAGMTAPIEFQKHAVEQNRIRVVNPAGMPVWGNLFTGVPSFLDFDENDIYLEFDITDHNNVLMAQNPYPLGFIINFSDASCPACLYVIADENGTYAAPIVYQDGVIKFPKGNVVFGYDYDGELYGWSANAEGKMMYCEPNVTLTDYTIAANYAGMIVSADNKQSSAIIEFALGADVEAYKFIVVPGAIEDFDATVAAIKDGSAEGIVEATAEQTQYIVELTTGNYTVVAVAYAGGESVGSPAKSFFYFPGASGGEKPEAQVAFMVDSLANIFADDADRAAQMEAAYPAEYFVGVVLGIENPEEITGLRFYNNDTAAVHKAIEEGVFQDYAEIVEKYGSNVYNWVEKINEGNIRILNLPANSDCCYIFAVDTIYGTTQYYHYDYDMPDYTGHFAVSQYVLSEGETTSNVNFTPGTDATTLLVEFDIMPGFQFYAGYDEEAQTLTLDGWAYGYEQYESLFGKSLPLGPDEANPYLVLMPFSDAQMTTPAQAIEIKLTENVPAQLNTYFGVFKANASGEPTGIVCKFTPAATFAPAAAALSLSNSAEFKSVMINTTTEMIELPAQQIVIKPYYGNYVREYSVSKNSAKQF